jgi:CBS domain-containing protein
MASTVEHIMKKDPVTLQAKAPILEAARAMRDKHIGNVVVLEGEKICGIVTDRDIVVRGLADGKDTKQTPLAEICSRDLLTVAPESSIDDAIQIMRDKAVRRLPVVSAGKPVGIVSLGDLALERDPDSVLGKISASIPNH